jgi:4-hydroxybenzoate polyprenyltransferase
MSRWTGWLALMRLSNLPTVVSNVLTGAAVGYGSVAAVSGREVAGGILPSLLAGSWLMLLAGGLFYVGGMMWNDLADRHQDATERPERPLPAGLVSAASARIAIVGCMAGGLVLAASHGVWAGGVAVALVVAIGVYNVTHRRFVWAPGLMGLCRALLYPLGALAAVGAAQPEVWDWVLPLAAIVGLYVVGVTFFARAEKAPSPGRRRWLSLLLGPLVLLAALFVGPVSDQALSWTIAAALLLVGWLGWCSHHVLRAAPNTGGAVQRWLAGLCLIDTYFLALLGMPAVAGVSVVCFALTRLAQRRIIGT